MKTHKKYAQRAARCQKKKKKFTFAKNLPINFSLKKTKKNKTINLYVSK